jgi:LuxR family transcriptional regulator, positive regulator of biofilm formation
METANSLPLTNICIQIIGPFHMQNQLLCSFLEENTGADCLVGKCFEQIQGEKRKKAVILWDCQGKNAREMMNEIGSVSSVFLKDQIMLLFNLNKDIRFENEAVQFGIRGIIYEHENFSLLPKAIKAVLNDEMWLSRSFMSHWIISTKKNGNSPKYENNLTPKEVEILQLIAQGTGNKEIAEKLFISCNTTKTHVYNIFKKIHVNSRLQAALWARKHLSS